MAPPKSSVPASKKPGAALGTLLLEVQDLRQDSGPELGQVLRWSPWRM